MKKLLLALICVGLVASCTKPQQRCVGMEDDPKTLYSQGMDAVEAGKLDVAQGKFERINYCEFEKVSKGYAGLAVTFAAKSLTQKNQQFASVEAGNALSNLKLAEDKAKTNEDKFDNALAGIRIYTAVKGGDWMDKVEDFYKDAVKLEVNENNLVYYQGKEAAHYFMGDAYLAKREFSKARDMYQKVMEAKKTGKWNEKADKGWKRVDKIVRATAGIALGDLGKKMALEPKVSRAALTALLLSEMKLDKILQGRIAVANKSEAEFTPADVLNHPYKDEVLTLMKFNVRGLEPMPDAATKAYLFKPDEPVTRKEFAFILEDILAKLTGDEKLYTAYFGNDKSPYPDVSPKSPWYNSVMNSVTRGLMEAELTGEFRPDDVIDGAEALLALRVLKQRVNVN